MFREYFGVAEDPFSITPDTRYLFHSERHRNAFAHLLYGVAHAGGFVQLTGETSVHRPVVAEGDVPAPESAGTAAVAPGSDETSPPAQASRATAQAQKQIPY